MSAYINCTLALLALLNPLSKIFIISTLSQEADAPSIRHIAVKASLIAAGILITFTFAGNFFLSRIFHVNIFSFQIIGGLILGLRGYQALNKGLFFEADVHQRLEDASIVPLASPMIAGPATITAAISFPTQYGFAPTLAAIVAGVGINLVLMLYTQPISRFLTRFNLMGALIRITGLIVATIGVQMVLDGIAAYLAYLGYPAGK